MLNEFKNKAISIIEKSNSDKSYGIKKTIVEKIVRQLANNIVSHNDKIILDLDFWIELSKDEFIAKNSYTAYYFSKELIKEKIVSKRSAIYPKNNRLININPLSKAFIDSDIAKYYDNALDFRDELKDKLLNKSTNSDDKELFLFTYLELFSITKVADEYYKYFERENLFRFDDMVALIFTIKTENDFRPINVIMFDAFTSKLLIEIFFTYHKSLLDYRNEIFTNYISEYKKQVAKICIEKAITKTQFRKATQLEYQLHSSALEYTLQSYTRYPAVTVSELDYMYPGVISKELLEIDRKNLEIYRNENQNSDEDIEDESDVEDELYKNYELYCEFEKIRFVPEKKGIEKYLLKWNKFLDKNININNEFIDIFLYVKELIKSVDKNSDIKKIKTKTLRAYLQVLFQYAFKNIAQDGLNDNTIKIIDDKIKYDAILTTKSRIKYRAIFNRFLRFTNSDLLKKLDSIIYYSRSIVFPKEYEKLIQKLQYRDKNNSSFIMKNRRVVYAILAYNSGCRKIELLSRTIKDIYFIENDTKLVIDINKNGINRINKYLNAKNPFGLKNSNAKRRVEFTINSMKHLNIVKKYLQEIDKSKCEFIFPTINKSKTISKKRVMKVQEIDEIGELLYKTTNRYTPLYSLRHTYATNRLFEILNLKSDRKLNDIFELSNMMGHSEPDVTLANYTHLGLYKVWKY